eukprot:jgi/Botrbrau1/11304/Bobra.0038s0066.2
MSASTECLSRNLTSAGAFTEKENLGMQAPRLLQFGHNAGMESIKSRSISALPSKRKLDMGDAMEFFAKEKLSRTGERETRGLANSNSVQVQGVSVSTSMGPAIDSCQMLCPSLSVEKFEAASLDEMQYSARVTFVSTHCYMGQTFDIKQSKQPACHNGALEDMDIDTDDCLAVCGNSVNDVSFRFDDGKPVHAGIHGLGYASQGNVGNNAAPSPSQQNRILSRLPHLEATSQSPFVSPMSKAAGDFGANLGKPPIMGPVRRCLAFVSQKS